MKLLRILVSAFLAVALVLPAVPAFALFTCPMDGKTRTKCCCPADDAEGQAFVAPSSDCCEVMVVESAPVWIGDHPASEPPTSPQQPAAPSYFAAELSELASHPRLIAPAGARAPPAPSPAPIYIQVCSLLI